MKQEENLIIALIIVTKNPNYHIYNKLGCLFSTQCTPIIELISARFREVEEVYRRSF